MKTLTKVLAITCLALLGVSLAAIVGWNAEFHSNPVFQIGSIANVLVGFGAAAINQSMR
jgi:hypothetical protein